MIELQEKVISNTMDIKKALAILMKKLDSADGTSVTPLPNGIVLPISSKDQFEATEEVLSADEAAKKLVSIVSYNVI